MGRFMTIHPSRIKPSQDFLKEKTVRHILDCIANDNEDELPSTPIVRECPEGYIAIDGHNLIAVYDMMDKDIRVYVAESASDELPESMQERKQDLSEKFDKVLQGANSFRELRMRYPHLLVQS